MTDNAIIRREDMPLTELGAIFAKSGYFNDAREAAQAIVKIQAGRELGFSPVASMTGIYIVKGRVTLSANIIGAAIRLSRRYDFRVTMHSENECIIQFTLTASGEVLGDSSFTMAQARQAGLDKGDNWKGHPKNMLFARAMSNGAKWYCPDVFSGSIYTPDELGARIDGETGEVIQIESAAMPPAGAPRKVPSRLVNDPPGAAAPAAEPDASPTQRLAKLIAHYAIPAEVQSKWLAHFGLESLVDLSDRQAGSIIAGIHTRFAKAGA